MQKAVVNLKTFEAHFGEREQLGQILVNRPREARSLAIFGTTELNTNARRRSCDRTNSLVRSSIDMTAARRESSACLRQRPKNQGL
jgi:hypothetical protein